MQVANMRDDEAAAVAALHRLGAFDSGPETEFDALVRVAAAACGVPIALFSLIDAERQWFKASVGLPGVSETHRDLAFCAHAVLGDELFVVDDASTDPRFADNDLVTGAPHIRFYAGAPVRLTHGERIGTICVIDREPRQLDDTQREVLKCLAEAAARALEGRHALRQSEKAAALAARAQLVLEHSADAIIGVAADGHVVRWNPAAERLFGHAAVDMIGRPLDALVPADRQQEDRGVLERVARGQAVTYDSIRLRADGAALNVSITAVPEFDAAGTLTGVAKFVRDITAQVRAAQRLAESEDRSRRQYESTPAMLHSIDPQGRLIAVSDLWLSTLGYRRDEVIGRDATEFLTPESRDVSRREVLPRLFATGRVDDVAYQVQTRGGERLDVLLTGRVEFDDHGAPVRTLSVMQDVTVRRRAEHALRDEKERLANIVDGTQAGTWEYWPATGAFAVNERLLAMLGLDRAQASLDFQDDFRSHLHPLDSPAVTQRLEAHISGATPSFEAEFRMRRGDGTWAWFLSRAKAVSRDGEGRALKMAGIQLDISRRVALSDAADASRRDLRTVLDALPSCVGYWDAHLVSRFANVAYHRWFGAAPDTIPGRHVRELLGDELFARNRGLMDAALRGEAQMFERTMPMPDGEGVRDMLVHYLPDDVNGEVRGFYVLVHDVSELKQIRRRAQVAARKSEALLTMIQQLAIFSVTDRAGCIIDANDAFCRISGYDHAELVGQTHRVVNSGTQGKQFWVDTWRTIAAGNSWRGEVCNRAKDGSLYWVDTMITPFVGDGGQIENYISVRFDITQAKDQARQLAFSEARYRALIEDQTDMISLATPDGRLSYVNDAYARRFGQVSSSMTGHMLFDFVPPNERALVLAHWEKVCSSVGPVEGENRSLSADGEYRWVAWTNRAIRDARGQVTAVHSVGRDITQRKLGEAAIRTTNQRFTLAADAAGLGVWEFDLQTQSLVWDEWMYRLYGHEPRDAYGAYELWAGSLHPEDRARTEHELTQAIAGRAPFNTEFRVIWPDRSVHHIKALAQVQRDAQGKALRITGVNLDITDRKTAEHDMQRTSALLQAVLDAATEVSIIAVDLGGMISLFNTGAERLLGHDRSEVLGSCSAMSFHDRDELRERARGMGAQLGRPVRTGMVLVDPAALGQPREWVYLRKDGSRVQVRLVVTAMHDADGECFGYLGVAHDISLQKDHERSLQHAADAAQRANLAKSQFLANMSHEIRTPLNALIGIGHLLAGSRLNGDQQQLLAKSQVAGRSLLGIVNDVLDVAKIEAGELTLDESPFQPRLLLDDVEALFRSQADEKGLSLEFDCAGQVPPWLVGDGQRVRQILVNLVGNAVKFTTRGGIRVSVQAEEAGASLVRLRCHVHDTGIGISADAQHRLFKAFSQADASTTRRYGGTGLGLSIVRQLAHAMAGEVSVRSEAGQGSEFRVTLSLTLPTAAQLDLALGQNATLEVVVVDDHLTDRQALAAHSRALGWRTVELGSGAALVALIEARRAGGADLPDAFIVDQQMPGMTGLQAVERLAELIGREALPTVLFVSAHDRSRIAELDVQRLAAATLAKPIGISDLFNAVNEGVARRTGRTTQVIRSTQVGGLHQRGLPGVRVLVVDDADINRDVARQLLEREGAWVQTCNNGREAVDCLRARPDAFDVVLMDVQMPEMDGIEATRLLRGELGLALPVVALTAGALVPERRRALAAGMTAFLSKPLDPQTMVSALRRAVEAWRGVALSVRQAGAKQALPVAWPVVEGIDADDAAMRTGGDVGLFMSIVGSLLREFGDLSWLDEIAPGEPGQSTALAARLHKMRGSLGTLGARKACQLATEAELALTTRDTDPAPAVAKLGAALRALFEAAAPVLAAHAAVAASRAREASDGSDTLAPTRREREDLIALLRRQDMAALDRFDALAPGLMGVLGADGLQQVRQALDDLDFSAAVSLLDAVAA